MGGRRRQRDPRIRALALEALGKWARLHELRPRDPRRRLSASHYHTRGRSPKTRLLDLAYPSRRCRARTHRGTPCKRSPSPGRGVCLLHGGRTPTKLDDMDFLRAQADEAERRLTLVRWARVRQHLHRRVKLRPPPDAFELALIAWLREDAA